MCSGHPKVHFGTIVEGSWGRRGGRVLGGSSGLPHYLVTPFTRGHASWRSSQITVLQVIPHHCLVPSSVLTTFKGCILCLRVYIRTRFTLFWLLSMVAFSVYEYIRTRFTLFWPLSRVAFSVLEYIRTRYTPVLTTLKGCILCLRVSKNTLYSVLTTLKGCIHCLRVYIRTRFILFWPLSKVAFSVFECI